MVIGEIGAGELAVRRHFALVPDGDVRIDAAPDQPAEHRAGAISDVGGEGVGREGEPSNGPLEHRLGGIDLFGDAVGVASTSTMIAVAKSMR